MLGRVVNFIGLLLSALIVVLIIYWGANLNNLHVEKLPVIKALEGEIRKKPPEELSRYKVQDLSINPLISGSNDSNIEKNITLAPEEEGLSVEDSNATMSPETGDLDMSEAIANALKQVLDEEDASNYSENTGEFKIIFNETESKADVEDFYSRLLLSFKSELSEVPYEIESLKIDGNSYFRLTLRGFTSKSRAIELRNFFSRNGIISEISIQ